MINTRAILLKLLLLPLVSYLTAMLLLLYIEHGLLVLIIYSTLSLHYFFTMASDERSNMLVAADEKNSTKKGSTVNGAISRWDEYIAFSIIVNFEIMPNYSLVSHAPFPPVVYFSGFHVLCFKYWLLYASYSQVMIRISFSMRHCEQIWHG